MSNLVKLDQRLPITAETVYDALPVHCQSEEIAIDLVEVEEAAGPQGLIAYVSELGLRVTRLEQRVDDHESRIAALERRPQALPSPPPTINVSVGGGGHYGDHLFALCYTFCFIAALLAVSLYRLEYQRLQQPQQVEVMR